MLKHSGHNQAGKPLLALALSGLGEAGLSRTKRKWKLWAGRGASPGILGFSFGTEKLSPSTLREGLGEEIPAPISVTLPSPIDDFHCLNLNCARKGG